VLPPRLADQVADSEQLAAHRKLVGRVETATAKPAGPENDFTNRNTTLLTWNLLHLAWMLKDAGGIPAHGNQRSEWDAGCRFDFANPDYR